MLLKAYPLSAASRGRSLDRRIPSSSEFSLTCNLHFATTFGLFKIYQLSIETDAWRLPLV